VAACQRQCFGMRPPGDPVGGGDHLSGGAQALGNCRLRPIGRRSETACTNMLVIGRRRHTGGVAGEAVEPLVVIGHDIAADAFAFIRHGDFRPLAVRLLRQAADCLRMPTAADQHHFAAAGLAQCPSRIRRHRAFARQFLWIFRAFGPQQVEIAVEPLFDFRRGRLLGERIPDGVEPILAQRLAEGRLGSGGTCRVRIGIAIGAVAEIGMPGRQVAEQRRGADLPGRLQRLPFRGIVAERCIGGECPCRRHMIAEDRDRQLLLQSEIIDMRIEVRRSLDQHIGRPRPLDGVRDHAGTGRRVMAHAEHRQPAIAFSRFVPIRA
jgi:hypothetical protein